MMDIYGFGYMAKILLACFDFLIGFDLNSLPLIISAHDAAEHYHSSYPVRI